MGERRDRTLVDQVGRGLKQDLGTRVTTEEYGGRPIRAGLNPQSNFW